MVGGAKPKQCQILNPQHSKSWAKDLGESSDIKIPVYCDKKCRLKLMRTKTSSPGATLIRRCRIPHELGVTYEGADYDAIRRNFSVDTRQCLDNNSLSKYSLNS